MSGTGQIMRVTAILVALGLTASACGGGEEAGGTGDSVGGAGGASESGETAAGGQVALSVLHWEPGGPEYWQAVEETFEESHPTIDLQFEAVPFDRYSEVQGPHITSASGPDVMANNAGLEIFDRKAAYMPLNDRLEGVADQLVSYNGACEDFDTANPCYGLPFSYQGNVMYFNHSVLEEAGLDPDNPPGTWEEFGQACEAVESIGKTCLALGMTGVFPAYWDFPEIARNFLTEDQIRALLGGELDWTGPELKQTLEYMAQIPEQGWINENATSISMLPEGADLFQSGEAAFAGTIISDAVNWQAFGDALGTENLGVMRWPVIEQDAPLAEKFSGIEGSVYGITTWSDNPEEAWEFVSWLAGEENANLWVELANGVPLNKGVNESLFPDSPAYQEIQEIIQDPTLHAGVMLAGQETDALSRGWQQVALGQLTVDQWAEQMQQALERSSKRAGQ